MKMNLNCIKLPVGRVKVLTINPSYPYKGVIVGRDDSFLYLDTDSVSSKFMGVVIIPFTNINYIQEVQKHE